MELITLKEKCKLCSTELLADRNVMKKWCPKCEMVGIDTIQDLKEKEIHLGY